MSTKMKNSEHVKFHTQIALITCIRTRHNFTLMSKGCIKYKNSAPDIRGQS